MDKNKYVEIRGRNNFLFLYYNWHNGILRKEAPFLELFDSWIKLTYGIPLAVAKETIIKILDKKHQYIR